MSKEGKHWHEGKQYTMKELAAILDNKITVDGLGKRVRKHGVPKAMAMGAADGRTNRSGRKVKGTRWRKAGDPYNHDQEWEMQIKRWLAAGMPISEMMIKSRL